MVLLTGKIYDVKRYAIIEVSVTIPQTDNSIQSLQPNATSELSIRISLGYVRSSNIGLFQILN